MDFEGSNRPPKRNKRAQPKCPSTSIQGIPILPPELISEILSRLSVKSLWKLRSVSKSWLALISSPQFIKTHLTLSAKNKEDTHHMLFLDLSEDKCNYKECLIRSLFVDSVTTEAFHLDYPIQNVSKRIRIEGSCNGLILLADYLESSLLWNPTTRMHKNLPDFRPTRKKRFARYGFGYDELHDDYKVLGISYNNNGVGSNDVEPKIYSLKSDSWTSVDYCGEILNSSGDNGELRLIGSGLFANGKFLWDTITAGPNLDRPKGRNIISFDLANEKWEKVEKPSYGVGETELRVGMFGSDLCVFSDYNGTHLGAWVMKEYGVKESWIKMFTIRYPIDQKLYPRFFMPNNGEILVACGSTFMIYNPKDDSFRYPNVINFDGYYDVDIYLESLVCPFFNGSDSETNKSKAEKAQIKITE